ncbi:Hypothetical predicted protein [Olea europaea subsp. europaea]|uniref:Uncharacterized protein n=1 Tax=Olea europaea subsp. europaea TaxID=158383 RepID=A0A8S0U8J2_OLEEU|nr:Hypothetical predicted protein [Olea europaea subsp. europaea]
MEMETDEIGDPILSNGNRENEAVVISTPKVEGESSGNVVFSREAPLERLLECNEDEVLKTEVGAKVQKKIETERAGTLTARFSYNYLLFKTFIDLAGNHLTGKDLTETFDARYFSFALSSSPIDHGWASVMSATSIQGLSGMLVEGRANNVNQAYVFLHYLLNPRMVKRMRQLLTTYKEDILILNLKDKVNLKGRDVMVLFPWTVILIGLV